MCVNGVVIDSFCGVTYTSRRVGSTVWHVHSFGAPLRSPCSRQHLLLSLPIQWLSTRNIKNQREGKRHQRLTSMVLPDIFALFYFPYDDHTAII